MSPDDFFTRDEFEACDESDRARYMIQVLNSLGLARGRNDVDTLVAVAKHYREVLVWTLPPEEYDRIVRTSVPGEAWENAACTRDVLEGALERGDEPTDGRELAQDLLESTRTVQPRKQEPDDRPDV
jgi:hypothetical protein